MRHVNYLKARCGRWIYPWLGGIKFLLLGIFFSGLFNYPVHSEVRLAIISTTADGEALADLLATEVSNLGGLQVVERQGLQKTWAENKLQPFSSNAVTRAGQLLHADALAVLEVRRLTKGYSAQLRLSSISKGVVAGVWNTPVPEESLADWAKITAKLLGTTASKLDPSGAVLPLTFLGLTSVSSLPDERTLVREVNGLLSRLLVNQPGILLMERERLIEATFEKMLNGDDQKFWNGAYVLDGTLNPNQVASGNVELVIRLVSSSSNHHPVVNVSGKRADLHKLVEECVQKVREQIGISAQKIAPFDPKNEASRFHEEADLAVRSGLWQEAMAAADAALALGKDDKEAAIVRLAAYTGAIKPNDYEVIYRTIKPVFGVREHYAPAQSSRDLGITLETAYQLVNLTSASKIGGEEDLRKAVTEALHALGTVGYQYYFGPELRAGKEEYLAQLRSIMKLVTSAHLQAHLTTFTNSPSQPILSTELNELIELFASFRHYAPLWGDTPEAGADILREFRASPIWFQVSEKVEEMDQFLWMPKLCGWSWISRQRCDDVWFGFESEQRLVLSALGRAQAVAGAPSDATVQRIINDTIIYFEKEKQALRQVKYKTEFESTLQQAWAHQSELIEPSLRKKIEVNELSGLIRLLKSIDEATANGTVPIRGVPSTPISRISDRINHALSKGELPPPELLSRLNFASREEKTKGLEALKKIRTLPDSPAKTKMNSLVEGLIVSLERQLTPLATAQKPRMVTGLSNSTPVSAGTSESITARYFVLSGTNGTIQQVAWGQNSLWILYKVEGYRSWYNEKNRQAGTELMRDYYLGKLNPTSGKAENFKIPEKFFSLQQNAEEVQLALFPRMVGLLFHNTLVKYDRASREYTSGPAPLANGRIFQAGGNTWLYNREMILVSTNELSSFGVAASIRRRPQKSPLDSFSSLEGAQFGISSAANTFVSVGEKQFLVRGEQLVEHTSGGELGNFQAPVTFTSFTGQRLDGEIQGKKFTLEFVPFQWTKATLTIFGADAKQSSMSVTFPGRTFSGATIPQTKVTVAEGQLFVWSPKAPGIWSVSREQLTDLLKGSTK